VNIDETNDAIDQLQRTKQISVREKIRQSISMQSRAAHAFVNKHTPDQMPFSSFGKENKLNKQTTKNNHIRILCIASLEASLTNQCRLLIAKTGGDRNAGKRTIVNFAIDLGRRLDRWKDGARHTKVLEENVVPLAGAQIHEHGATRIGNIGDMHATVGGTTGEIPNEPRIDSAGETGAVLHGLRNSGNVLAQPAQLETAEVGGNGQTTTLLKHIGTAELLGHGVDNVASARIEPNNGLESNRTNNKFSFGTSFESREHTL
jgi:hypothetical protein